MKWIKSMGLLITIVLMGLSGCEKKDDIKISEDPPAAKKLKKVYMNYQVPGGNIEKRLSESWIYDEYGRISKIYYYGYGTHSSTDSLVFNYNTSNQISEIELYGVDFYNNCIFNYEGKYIKKIEVFANREFSYFYEFEWINSQVSKITVFHQLENSKGINEKNIIIDQILTKLFQKEIIDFMKKIEYDFNSSKVLLLKYSYDITWKNDNIIKMEFNEPVAEYSSTIEMKYDTYRNPLYSSYPEIIGINYFERFFSRNNVIERTVTDETGTSKTLYTYIYDEGYPVQSKETYEGDLSTIYYEYEE